MRCELFLGPIDSGKSAFAEARMLESCAGLKPLYIATLPRNRAFQPRISKHRHSRGDSWHVVEITRSLDEVFAVPGEWLSGGVLLDGLVALVARRLQAALTLGSDAREEGRELLGKYITFLDWMAPRTQVLFVVSNVVSQSACLDPVDLEIAETNKTLCSVTAERSVAVWLSSRGETERIDRRTAAS